MARIEMNATELTNTDVNFVSLVKRGANRIPFRIVKGDTDMDLYAIGRRIFQKSEPVPTVVAVISQKWDNDTREQLGIIAKSVGIDTGRLQKSDDQVVTLTKADADATGAAIVKLDRNTAIAIKGSNIEAAFRNHDFSEGLFKDADGRKGFHVGPSAATRMFNGYSAELVKTATDPSELSTQIAKAADDYRAYMGALSIGLPRAALAADQLVKGWNDDDDMDDDDAGGTDDDGTDDSGDGDQDNGGKKKTMKSSSLGNSLLDEGDPGAADPLMPAKDSAKKPFKAVKADAGKNGTGAGFSFEDSSDGATSDQATADDKENNEVDAKPGKRVSGDNSGMPSRAMAPTKKSEAILKAELAVAKAELALALSKDSIKGLPDPKGESQAGEGMDEALDHRDVVSDEDVTGAAVTGKVKGKTLDMDGVPTKLKAPTKKDDEIEDDDSTNGAQSDIPAKAKAPTKKNDGDANSFDKDKSKSRQLEDDMSGAGAQEADVQTMKSDRDLVRMVSQLAKQMRETNAAVTKSVTELARKVDTATALARKTDAALHGTVFNETDGDRVTTIKSERTGDIPLLDTAFSRRA